MTFEEWWEKGGGGAHGVVKEFARIAWEAATAAERERCAKVCEDNRDDPDSHKDYEGYEDGWTDCANLLSDEIRAG
jgi:hypothetical protein